MKQTWDKLNKDVTNFQDPFQELLESLPQSQFYYKLQNKLENRWRTFSITFNLMEEFVQPIITSIKIECPLLASPEFKATWKLWKDYLKEQHATHMRSRSELMSLKRLNTISKGDAKEAIFILEYAMGCNGAYNNFFPVDKEKALGAAAAAEAKQSNTTYSLPQQYLKNKPTETKVHQTTLDEQIKREQIKS